MKIVSNTTNFEEWQIKPSTGITHRNWYKGLEAKSEAL